MLAFGSPESAKMADLIVEAFSEVSAGGSFNEVRVLFIGKAEDSERVAQAVAASGAEYVFVEAK
jgi:sirohydrochlorin ferrochelatase